MKLPQIATLKPKLYLLLTTILLCACGGGGSDSSSSYDPNDTAENNYSPGTSVSEYLSSEITGIYYPLSIRLPENYDENDALGFQVVYATDGQWSFENYSRIIAQSGKQLILVSIHQGPENRRAIDYILPGARNYFLFLTTELIPYIEENYAASPDNRTIIGESGGGMLVINTMLQDDPENPVFSNLLSMDAPSFGIQTAATMSLERERQSRGQTMPVNLILTGATRNADIGPFDDEVEAFYQYMLLQDYQGIEITRRSYDVDHYNIGTPSFTEAIPIFYGD